MKALTHKDFRKLGFAGNHTAGYTLGNIDVFIYEDDDCNDRFRLFADGIDRGWVKTFEQLETILEMNLIND